MSTQFGTNAEREILETESSGSAVEAFGGLGVVILSIIGLAGGAPDILAACAGVVFGASLFAQGTAVASEYSGLYQQITGGTAGAFELSGGMTVEFIAGGAAVVLGILALVGESPAILLPSLVIAGGAALVLSTGTVQRLNTLKVEAAGARDFAQKVATGAVAGVVGAQLLAGLAAAILGILALVHQPATEMATGAWMTLTLVGLLILGSAITLSGGALAGRLMQMFNRIRPQS